MKPNQLSAVAHTHTHTHTHHEASVSAQADRDRGPRSSFTRLVQVSTRLSPEGSSTSSTVSDSISRGNSLFFAFFAESRALSCPLGHFGGMFRAWFSSFGRGPPDFRPNWARNAHVSIGREFWLGGYAPFSESNNIARRSPYALMNYMAEGGKQWPLSG